MCLKFFIKNYRTLDCLINVSERLLHILGVVKRNPLFFHSISCKNNGFLFTTPNIIRDIRVHIKEI